MMNKQIYQEEEEEEEKNQKKFYILKQSHNNEILTYFITHTLNLCKKKKNIYIFEIIYSNNVFNPFFF